MCAHKREREREEGRRDKGGKGREEETGEVGGTEGEEEERREIFS